MLSGKIAFITGATRGIGRSITEVFAENGANLILNSRDEESSLVFAEYLRNKYKVNVDVVIFDISDADAIKDAFRKIFKLTKKLDIVVNNAGILESSLIGMVSKENIEKTYTTNVYAVYYILQYASRLMSRSKSGSIINLTSIMGVNGSEGQAVYSGSKAAIIGITKSLAKELALNNIRVNAIAPGFIETDMTCNLSPEKYKERVSSIKIGRVGKPEDIANVALFLASDLSSYLTGQVVGVDGGMLL